MDILSNGWIALMLDKYSMAIAGLLGILKIVARLDKNNTTNSIIELLSWKKK